MNQVKRISSTLNVFASELGQPTRLVIGQPTPNNAEVTINGNLTVQGTTTTVNSEELTIADNFVVLNSNVTGTPLPSPDGDGGVIINRGTSPNVAIQWSETTGKWQLTNDGTNYYNISTQVGGAYLSAVVEDLNPELGGNLNVSTFSITSPTSVKVEAPIRLTNVSTAPAVEPGYSIVYAAETEGGGSGVFVASGASANEELVSKKKAIIFSLIF